LVYNFKAKFQNVPKGHLNRLVSCAFLHCELNISNRFSVLNAKILGYESGACIVCTIKTSRPNWKGVYSVSGMRSL
jgi:hypothetical protein